MQRYDTTNVPRHAWLLANPPRVPTVRGNAAGAVLSGSMHSSPMRKRSILTTLPPEALAAVTQCFDLPTLARVEATALGWRPALATAVHVWVQRDYGPGRASWVRPLPRPDGPRHHFPSSSGTYGSLNGSSNGSVGRSGSDGNPGMHSASKAPRMETWARVLRFVLQAEARCVNNDGLLATGADARHSLVITPSESKPPNSTAATKVGGGSGESGESVRALQSFGWGLFGQTGQGQFEPQTLPAYVEPFAPSSWAYHSSQTQALSSSDASAVPPRIVQASCGATHSLAVDDSGTCWSWGEDASRFTCRPAASAGGVGTAAALPRVPRPQPVVSGGSRNAHVGGGGGVARILEGCYGFGSVRVVAVAAGARFSLCLDDQGGVWSWGSAAWGCLGHGNATKHSNGLGSRSMDGSSGGGIDNSGRTPRDEPTPRRIEMLNSAEPSAHQSSFMEPEEAAIIAASRVNVVKIACGPRHCLAVDSQGKLWSWGCNREGALGTGDFRGRGAPTLAWPPALPSPSHRRATADAAQVTMLAERAGHFSFRSSGGGGLSSSWGNAERSFPNDRASQQQHTRFSEAGNNRCCGTEEKINSAVAGGAHTLVVTSLGRLLTCGANHRGQLGRPIPPSPDPTTNTTTTAAQPLGEFSQTSRTAAPHVVPGHQRWSGNNNNNNDSYSSSSSHRGTSGGSRGVPKHLQVTPAWAPGSGCTSSSSGSCVSSGVDLECDAFFRVVECSLDNGFHGGVPRQTSEASRGGDGGALNLTQMLLGGRQNNSAATSANATNRYSTDSTRSGGNSQGSSVAWVSAAGGGAHSVALRADGSCWVWGSNARGQLGLGDNYSARLAAGGSRHNQTAGTTSAGGAGSARGGLNSAYLGGCGGSGVMRRSSVQPSVSEPASPSSSSSSSTSTSQRVVGPVGGLPLRPDVREPLLVTALRGVSVAQVACGANHTLFLAEAPTAPSGAAAAPSTAAAAAAAAATRRSGTGGARAAYSPPRVFSCGEGGQGQLGTVHAYFGDVGICDNHALPSPVDLLHPRPRDAPFTEAPQTLPIQVQRQLGSLHVGLAAKPKPEDNGRLRYV